MVIYSEIGHIPGILDVSAFPICSQLSVRWVNHRGQIFPQYHVANLKFSRTNLFQPIVSQSLLVLCQMDQGCLSSLLSEVEGFF